MNEQIEDFERLLIFFHVLSEPPKDKQEQIKRFVQISGLTPAQAQSALDVCVLRGFVDDVK